MREDLSIGTNDFTDPDARKQGWHDKMAGTVVVRSRRG
jgi:hypothetical protein